MMTKLCLSFVSALAFSFFSSSLAAHSGHNHSADTAQLEVSNAQVREFLPGGKASAAYLTISNHSGVNATLTKASIDGLARVEIHEHAHVDGMMKMQKVESVVVKAHESVDFQPGGYHLMVFEPQEPLKAGQERKLTLYFSDGNRLFTNIEVVTLESQINKAKSSAQHSHH